MVATTLYDVAQLAGVTATTVSNVVRGKGSVGVHTRARVLHAIEELDYRPNLVARGLVHRRTSTLALLLPSIANPFYPEIALEIEDIADEHDYRLLLCNTHDDPLRGRTHLDALAGHRVDGIVVMAGGVRPWDAHAASQRGMPIVLCNWSEVEQGHDMPAVDIDFRHGGRLAALHLLELGRREIGVIVQESGDHDHHPSHTQRVEGFMVTLVEGNTAIAPEAVVLGSGALESGYHAARVLLGRSPRPTAIFATNDMMALGALEAIADAGLSVPDDVAVIGFDDIALGRHVRPTLTTIAIPKRDLAAQTMATLFRLIDGTDVPACVTIPPYLVVRRSTVRDRGPGAASAAEGGG